MNGPERLSQARRLQTWSRPVLARQDRDPGGSGEKLAGQAETDIVVAVVLLVPVAVGRAEVLWIVVPGTAAQNAKRLGSHSGSGARCEYDLRGPEAEEVRSAARRNGQGRAARPGPFAKPALKEILVASRARFERVLASIGVLKR